jgi:hypothetical protein
MIASAVTFFLSNIPGFMFAGAILAALAFNKPAYFPERLMNWLLLMSVGVMNLWAGLFHVFAPEMSARTIGWQDSPFHFEIGVSDIAIGIIAIASFWRSLEFKAAIVGYITLFYIGIAIGHIRQAIVVGNMASNNFGLLLIITLATLIMLPILYWLTRKNRSTG